MATELGDAEIAGVLISARADVHALDETRWPLLSDWLFRNYLPPDEILLQVEHFSANFHPTKQPPIILAAELGRVEALRVLLSANANINSLDEKSRTALAWAVENRHDTAVEILLSIPGICVDSRDVTGQTPLIMAARRDGVKILNQLLKSNAAINSEDERKWTSLSWAAANGHERIVELLLSAHGIIVDHHDEQGRTPFSLAAERGSIQIMHLLIENGADPHILDSEGHTGFWWFMRARHDLYISSPNQLIRPVHGGTVNPFSLQALIWALPTPNKKDRSGRNWLSWAAEYGDDEVIRYFLQFKDKADKVDINICDGNEDLFSRTPLIWALERGNKASIDLLKGCDTISLHLLVEGISSIETENVSGLVTTLLNVGYNFNQPDQKGRTPLHLACIKGSQELASALIKGKADIRSRDHTGETPLQYALKSRSKALVDLLLNAHSTDLKPVRSQEWFAVGDKRPSWIQITRRIQSGGYRLELINDVACDWLPRAREARLW
jgi:ankyrin repeat protein